MTLLVDASVVVKRFLPEEHSESAMQLLRTRSDLVAPDLLVPELLSVLWKGCVRGTLPRLQALELAASLGDVPVALTPSVQLAPMAFELALTTGRSSYYMLYLALALRERCPLITADLRLYNSLKDAFSETMRWIGDFPAAAAGAAE